MSSSAVAPPIDDTQDFLAGVSLNGVHGIGRDAIEWVSQTPLSLSSSKPSLERWGLDLALGMSPSTFRHCLRILLPHTPRGVPRSFTEEFSLRAHGVLK